MQAVQGRKKQPSAVVIDIPDDAISIFLTQFSQCLDAMMAVYYLKEARLPRMRPNNNRLISAGPPDIRNQLVEVKLQTSPTIDLGLVCPDSEEILDIPRIKGKQIRHRDVRYVLFYASTDGMKVTLTHAYVATGEIFFSRFPRFEGKVINKKIQLMLPNDFFAL